MSKVIKLVLVLLVIVFAAKGYDYLREQRVAEESSPDHEMDAADLLIGRGHVEAYLNIKEKAPKFNLPALQTAMAQFHINNGRYPRTLAELEAANLAGRDLTHDPYGQPYRLQYENRTVTLSSPGKDKQPGTEDDIELSLTLQ